MPIKIPRLRQLRPSTALPANDRLNLKVQNQAQNILSRTNTLTSLGSQVGEVSRHFEDEKINTLSNEAELEYSRWNTEKLQNLKAHKGDPTDAYAQYDLDEKEKADEIINSRPDLNERVRGHLTNNLNKLRDSRSIGVLKQRGYQQEIYNNNLFESSVKLKKNNLSDSVGFIRADDEGSFLPFEQNIADIRTLIAKKALDDGSAERLPDDAKTWNHIYTDQEGEVVKVSMNDAVKLRTAKDVSEGVTSSVDVLINTGFSAEAKILKERYRKFIDPRSLATIEKKIDKLDTKDEAFKIVGEIEKLPEDQRTNRINKISDKNPELGSEVLKLVDGNERRRTSRRKRREDSNYNLLHKQIVKQDYISIAELEADPVYKKTWDSLSGKQQQAIEEEFIRPSKSDQKVLSKVYDIINGDHPTLKPGTMTGAQITEELAGLNGPDNRRLSNKILSRQSKKLAVSDKTYNRGAKILKTKLFAEELIQNDKRGRIKREDLIKLNKAYDDLTDFLDEVPNDISRKELSDHIDVYIADKKREKLFKSGGLFNLIFSSDEEITPRPSSIRPKSDPLEGLENDEIFKLQRDFKRKFNRASPPSPNDPAFLRFVREQ